MGKLFYIQDARQYVGNSVLWWRHEGQGYTTDMDQAGLFTEERVRALPRKTDVPWPKEVVNAIVSRHVDMQKLPDRERLSAIKEVGR